MIRAAFAVRFFFPGKGGTDLENKKVKYVIEHEYEGDTEFIQIFSELIESKIREELARWIKSH